MTVDRVVRGSLYETWAGGTEGFVGDRTGALGPSSSSFGGSPGTTHVSPRRRLVTSFRGSTDNACRRRNTRVSSRSQIIRKATPPPKAIPAPTPKVIPRGHQKLAMSALPWSSVERLRTARDETTKAISTSTNPVRTKTRRGSDALYGPRGSEYSATRLEVLRRSISLSVPSGSLSIRSSSCRMVRLFSAAAPPTDQTVVKVAATRPRIDVSKTPIAADDSGYWWDALPIRRCRRHLRSHHVRRTTERLRVVER